MADGGQVLLSAGARDALLASVVNNSGVIQARTVENRSGIIILLGGMAAGTANVAGTLDASAPNGGNGGFIETSGAQVNVADGARISTAAPAGNSGTWLIDPVDFNHRRLGRQHHRRDPGCQPGQRATSSSRAAAGTRARRATSTSTTW